MSTKLSLIVNIYIMSWNSSGWLGSFLLNNKTEIIELDSSTIWLESQEIQGINWVQSEIVNSISLIREGVKFQTISWDEQLWEIWLNQIKDYNNDNSISNIIIPNRNITTLLKSLKNTSWEKQKIIAEEFIKITTDLEVENALNNLNTWFNITKWKAQELIKKEIINRVEDLINKLDTNEPEKALEILKNMLIHQYSNISEVWNMCAEEVLKILNRTKRAHSRKAIIINFNSICRGKVGLNRVFATEFIKMTWSMSARIAISALNRERSVLEMLNIIESSEIIELYDGEIKKREIEAKIEKLERKKSWITYSFEWRKNNTK